MKSVAQCRAVSTQGVTKGVISEVGRFPTEAFGNGNKAASKIRSRAVGTVGSTVGNSESSLNGGAVRGVKSAPKTAETIEGNKSNQGSRTVPTTVVPLAQNEGGIRVPSLIRAFIAGLKKITSVLLLGAIFTALTAITPIHAQSVEPSLNAPAASAAPATPAATPAQNQGRRVLVPPSQTPAVSQKYTFVEALRNKAVLLSVNPGSTVVTLSAKPGTIIVGRDINQTGQPVEVVAQNDGGWTTASGDKVNVSVLYVTFNASDRELVNASNGEISVSYINGDIDRNTVEMIPYLVDVWTPGQGSVEQANNEVQALTVAPASQTTLQVVPATPAPAEQAANQSPTPATQNLQVTPAGSPVAPRGPVNNTLIVPQIANQPTAAQAGQQGGIIVPNVGSPVIQPTPQQSGLNVTSAGSPVAQQADQKTANLADIVKAQQAQATTTAPATQNLQVTPAGSPVAPRGPVNNTLIVPQIANQPPAAQAGQQGGIIVPNVGSPVVQQTTPVNGTLNVQAAKPAVTASTPTVGAGMVVVPAKPAEQQGASNQAAKTTNLLDKIAMPSNVVKIIDGDEDAIYGIYQSTYFKSVLAVSGGQGVIAVDANQVSQVIKDAINNATVERPLVWVRRPYSEALGYDPNVIPSDLLVNAVRGLNGSFQIPQGIATAPVGQAANQSPTPVVPTAIAPVAPAAPAASTAPAATARQPLEVTPSLSTATLSEIPLQTLTLTPRPMPVEQAATQAKQPLEVTPSLLTATLSEIPLQTLTLTPRSMPVENVQPVQISEATQPTPATVPNALANIQAAKPAEQQGASNPAAKTANLLDKIALPSNVVKIIDGDEDAIYGVYQGTYFKSVLAVSGGQGVIAVDANQVSQVIKDAINNATVERPLVWVRRPYSEALGYDPNVIPSDLLVNAVRGLNGSFQIPQGIATAPVGQAANQSPTPVVPTAIAPVAPAAPAASTAPAATARQPLEVTPSLSTATLSEIPLQTLTLTPRPMPVEQAATQAKQPLEVTPSLLTATLSEIPLQTLTLTPRSMPVENVQPAQISEATQPTPATEPLPLTAPVTPAVRPQTPTVAPVPQAATQPAPVNNAPVIAQNQTGNSEGFHGSAVQSVIFFIQQHAGTGDGILLVVGVLLFLSTRVRKGSIKGRRRGAIVALALAVVMGIVQLTRPINPTNNVPNNNPTQTFKQPALPESTEATTPSEVQTPAVPTLKPITIQDFNQEQAPVYGADIAAQIAQARAQALAQKPNGQLTPYFNQTIEQLGKDKLLNQYPADKTNEQKVIIQRQNDITYSQVQKDVMDKEALMLVAYDAQGRMQVKHAWDDIIKFNKDVYQQGLNTVVRHNLNQSSLWAG